MVLKGKDLKELLNSPDLVLKAIKFIIQTRLLGQFRGVAVTDR